MFGHFTILCMKGLKKSVLSVILCCFSFFYLTETTFGIVYVLHQGNCDRNIENINIYKILSGDTLFFISIDFFGGQPQWSSLKYDHAIFSHLSVKVHRK